MTREQLIQELTLSRIEIAQNAGRLSASLNVAERLKRSVKRSPAYWLGGAGLLGFCAAAFRRRKRPSAAKLPAHRQSGDAGDGAKARVRGVGLLALAATVLKAVFPVLRPVLISYASKAASRLASRVP